MFVTVTMKSLHFLRSAKSKTILVLLVLSLLLCTPSSALSPHPLVLLISFDGFRHDFLTPEDTPNLWQVAKEGVRVCHGSRSQFMSMTAPNHYSIVTGLHTESHGIVGNHFSDTELGQYSYWPVGWDTPEQDMVDYHGRLGKFYSGTPIWLLNQNEPTPPSSNRSVIPRLSGSMYFPHTDVKISGQFPSVYEAQQSCCDEKDTLDAWKSEFDKVVSWFTRKDPINLGLFYVAEPDHYEHLYGVNGTKTKQSIKDLDKLVGYMRQKLEKAELWEKINLIFTADHGMVPVKYPDNIIPMKDFLERAELVNWTQNVQYGCHRHCFMPTKEARSSEIDYERLYKDVKSAFERFAHGQVDVYLKDSKSARQLLSDKYHWYDNDRIGGVIFLERAPNYFDFNFTETTLDAYPPMMKGQHDFSPYLDVMRAMLVFHGPAFKNNFVFGSSEVQNIDLYPLMARILKLPTPPNNGSLSRLWPCVRSGYQGLFSSSVTNFIHSKKIPILFALTIAIPAALFLCYLCACVASHKRKNIGGIGGRPNGYMRVEDGRNELTDARPSHTRHKHTKTQPPKHSANGSKQLPQKPLLEIGDGIDSMSEDKL